MSEQRDKRRARIIAVANQKGGVGKTTTSVNLTSALHLRGRRVLLCDMDPQGNGTSGMGVSKSTTPGIYDAIMGKSDVRPAIVQTEFGDVIPASRELAGAIVELVDQEEREQFLAKTLRELVPDYDYILIDSPPSLELLTINALVAADSVLIPLQCEYYALEGLKDLLDTVRIIKTRMNRELSIEGVVLTMYDGRTRLAVQVEEQVRRLMNKRVFDTVIPRNVRLSEAPSHGKPIHAYDRSSKGARAYLKLANELIKQTDQEV